jgi:hypothetical protein
MGLLERAHSLQSAARRKEGLLHLGRRLFQRLTGSADFDRPTSPEELQSAPTSPPGGRNAILATEASSAAAIAVESEPEETTLLFEEVSGLPEVAEPRASEAGRPDSELRARTPEQIGQEVLSALTRLRRGFESPARLFDLLAEELGFSRAALLLYDPLRMVYAPWAGRGYDKTTVQRLRIPLGYNSTFDRLADGETLRLSEASELEQLRSFFSFREFSSLKHALLIPLMHVRKLIALLLITEQKPGPWGSDPTFYDSIAERSAELLYEARERHLEALTQDPSYLETFREELLVRPSALRDLILRRAAEAAANQTPLLAIRLTLQEVVGAVLKSVQGFESFRLREDISGIVMAIFSSVGTVARLDGDHLLVLVCTADPPDLETLTRHLESVLRYYYPSLAEHKNLGLQPEMRKWNGAADQADQILDSFDQNHAGDRGL